MIAGCLRQILPGLILLLSNVQNIKAQSPSNKENPPASVKKEQRWWNLLQYQVAIVPDYQNKYVSGTNKISFAAIDSGSVLQIDLMEPMHIDRVSWKNKSLAIKRINNEKYYIYFPGSIKAGESHSIEVTFSGIQLKR